MVHVFPAADHGLSPSSLPEEVLQRFHQITRAQVRIRAVGVDAPTGFAYVVTPEIDPDYISVWGMEPSANLTPFSTALFNNQMTGVSSQSADAEPAPPGAPAEQKPAVLEPYVASLEPATPSEPGAFTKEFLALQSRAAEPSAKPATAPPKPPSEPRLTDILRAVDAASGHPELSSPVPAGAERKGVPEAAPLPPAPAPAKPAAHDGPSFTALFGGAPLGSSPAPAAPAMKPNNAPANPKPGAFTAMFGAEEAKAHLEPTPPRPAAVPPAPASSAPKPGAFTAMFGAEEAKAHLERPSIPPPAPTPAAPAPKAGAFTAMFGAEEAKAHLERPSIPPPAPAPAAPAPKAGAFTAMFGAEEAKAHLEPKPGPGAFTRMFDSQEAPPHNPGVVGSPAPTPSIPAMPASTPSLPPVASAPQTNAPASPATRFFKGVDAVAAPKAPAIPSGPSEYTRVVKFSEALKEQGGGPGVPPTPGAGMGVPPAGVPASNEISGPSFRPPVMPGYPVMPGVQGVPAYPPQVQMPQYPSPQMPVPGQPYGIPGVAPPPMPQYQPPQFQAPPLPVPKVPPVAQPKSWMPLVILFLGLTVLALLIVLLFALRGH